MCQLAWEADLAITAGGLTMFELACVGTPSIVVCGEPFEVEPGIRLDKAGAVVSLGFGGGVDYAKLPDLVDDLSNGVEVRRRMSARGKESVDGRGCERTVGLIRERLEQARLPGV
jgi:spore coat polysaccharide biosynthesis predicted glycosyltransferase SpsG